MTFKILSLDGGGIRGVLSATILKELEKTLIEKTGKKLHEYFDLVTGTSTGSILAAAIACQMEVDDMIKLYKDEGSNIFLKSVRCKRHLLKLTQVITSNLLYPHEQGEQGLAKVLENNLIHPDLGKNVKISQIAKPYILIPAYDVYSRNTTWFNNGYNEKNSENIWYRDLELWKICTASASAPTFFPPYELPYNTDQSLPHIDGGVSANNPALMAIAHALYIDELKLKLSDIAVFSIGTGNTTRPYKYKDIKGWGQLGWSMHLPDMFMSPSIQNSGQICYQILNSVGKGYLRLDFDLNKRFKGEKKPGRLPETLTELDKPYNEYIFKQTNEYQEVSEDIDNPENCPELIKAAECYLECGTLDYYYKDKLGVDVRYAIKDFINSLSGDK